MLKFVKASVNYMLCIMGPLLEINTLRILFHLLELKCFVFNKVLNPFSRALIALNNSDLIFQSLVLVIISLGKSVLYVLFFQLQELFCHHM